MCDAFTMSPILTKTLLLQNTGEKRKAEKMRREEKVLVNVFVGP